VLERSRITLGIAVAVAAVAITTALVLLGRSRPARGLARLRVPLPQRLMVALPGVDVRVVADRSLRHQKTP
jgi:two-component system, OmpR family, sensor histidine kinase KdpD